MKLISDLFGMKHLHTDNFPEFHCILRNKNQPFKLIECI